LHFEYILWFYALNRLINVLVQPIGFVEPAIVERLAFDINSKVKFFRAIVSEYELPLIDEAYNSRRMQYNSSIILNYLSRSFGRISSNYRVLGVLDVDMYADALNFVFGEAMLGGGFAVISLYRLRPEFYGHSADLELFFERALKEAVHELGHTLGLRHCPNRRCVMHFSNSIADTDFKGYTFCSECEFKLMGMTLRFKV
jgi:archaemetzincin